MSKASTPKKVRQHCSVVSLTLSPPKASEEKKRNRSPARSDRTSEYGSESSSKLKTKDPQDKSSPWPHDHNPGSTRRPRSPSPDSVPLNQGSPTSTAFATVGATQDVGYTTPVREEQPPVQSYSEWAQKMREPARTNTTITGPHRNPRRTHTDSKRGRPKWYFPEKTFKGEWAPGREDTPMGGDGSEPLDQPVRLESGVMLHPPSEAYGSAQFDWAAIVGRGYTPEQWLTSAAPLTDCPPCRILPIAVSDKEAQLAADGDIQFLALVMRPAQLDIIQRVLGGIDYRQVTEDGMKDLAQRLQDFCHTSCIQFNTSGCLARTASGKQYVAGAAQLDAEVEARVRARLAELQPRINRYVTHDPTPPPPPPPPPTDGSIYTLTPGPHDTCIQNIVEPWNHASKNPAVFRGFADSIDVNGLGPEPPFGLPRDTPCLRFSDNATTQGTAPAPAISPFSAPSTPARPHVASGGETGTGKSSPTTSTWTKVTTKAMDGKWWSTPQGAQPGVPPPQLSHQETATLTTSSHDQATTRQEEEASSSNAGPKRPHVTRAPARDTTTKAGPKKLTTKKDPRYLTRRQARVAATDPEEGPDDQSVSMGHSSGSDDFPATQVDPYSSAPAGDEEL